jgi:phosphoesterase RecJ-like protein
VCEGRVAIFAITKEIQQKTQTSVVDSEGIADELLKCVSVEVSVLFFELDEEIKISFRGKGKVDLNSFVSQFGGGGHKNAAGLKVKDNLDKIKAKIIKKLERIL